jgi:anaerobic selenocysteine-containing dehydrogenase
MINAQTAAAKGIADGEEISIATPGGASARGIAKVSECIHPEVIGIASCFGHWAKARTTARGRGIHFNSLLPYGLNQIDAMAGLMDACVKVKVRKVRKNRTSSALS